MTTWYLVGGLALIFVGIVVAISMAGIIGKERSEIASSLAAIEAVGGPVPDEMRKMLDEPFGKRAGVPFMEGMAGFARSIAGANWPRNTEKRLQKAGNPIGWSVERVLAWKSILGVAFGAVVAVVLLSTGRPGPAVVWGIAAAVLGFFLPDIRLYDMANARGKAIQRALPDALDLLTISVESGLAFDAAVAQVARNTEGPLADELRRVLKEIQIGSSRSEALQAMSDRTDMEDLRIFVSSMIQAEKLGMPIADVLRVQAGEIRIKRSQRIEEAANKLPIKMIFPILFCIMPSVFIVLIGPAVLQIGDFFSGG